MNPSLSGSTRIIALALALGVIGMVAGLLNFQEPTAEAATAFTVNSTGEGADSNTGDGVCNDGSGNCTLRAAIQQANALAGADTINFSVTGTINLVGELPELSTDITITGPGADMLTVRRDTGGDYRIFTITAGTVAISGLTISNGMTHGGSVGHPLDAIPDNGGGILNKGSLALSNCVVSNNSVPHTSNGGYSGGGIANWVDATLTITNCTVSGNTAGFGGGISNGGTLTITNSSVSGNNATATGGGIISNSGTLIVTGSTLSNNTTSFSGGGGLSNFGPSAATITNSTIGNNSSVSAGGGVFNSGTLKITASTVSSNTGSFGGGIDNFDGTLTVTNSTVSGNNANGPAPDSGMGGGIYSANFGTTTVRNSTVTNNSANSFGGGFYNGNWQNAPTFQFGNSIVAGNTAASNGPDLYESITSQGHNLVGDATGATLTTTTGDQIGNSAGPINPRLGPLADNGGPNRTHKLLPGSPALDAGDNALAVDAGNNPLATDQRGTGFDRIVDAADADTTATVDIGAFEAQVSVEEIADKTGNEDTQLQFTFNVGGAASITGVSATSGNTTLVPNNASNIAVTGSGSTRTLTINPAAGKFGTTTITVNVNGNNNQVMTDTLLLTFNPVADTPSVTNSSTLEDTQTTTGLVISRNAADGAEVTHFKVSNIQHGTLLRNDGVTQVNAGDFITFAEGNAGLRFTPAQNFNNSLGTAGFDVQASTNNTDGGLGGGVVTANVSVTALNDTPSFNKGADQSVQINAGAQTLNNWATNLAPGPATAADESGQILNFIVTNDNSTLFSTQPAVSSSGTLTYTPGVNKFGQATVSVKLHDNGGTSNGGLDTSAVQTFNINVTCGAGDVVTNTNDGGAGSLRNAIATACPGDTITFDPAVFNSSSGPQTITLTSSGLTIDRNLSIKGPGANQLTVRRSAASDTPSFAVFFIPTGTTANLSGLTISGGASNGNGGGIGNLGILNLNNSTVSGNASGVGFLGGGIANFGTLNIAHSTVSGNTAGAGAGIANSSGTVNVNNCTVSGNTTTGGFGGGLFNTSSGVMRVTNSTVSNNFAGSVPGNGPGGGIFSSSSSTTTLANTIVAKNHAANNPDLFGPFSLLGFNLIGDTSGATLTETQNPGTNINGREPRLGPLANNGGATQTHLLLPGSPAINAGGNSLAVDAGNSPLTTDQRGTGFNRVVNTVVDIGAVEVNYATTATAGNSQTAPINTAYTAQLKVTLTESGNPLGGIPITFNAPASGASGTFQGTGTNIATVNTDASGVATAPVFTANGTAGGPFQVVASLGTGAASVNFSLTNAKGSQTITFNPLPDKSYGDPDFTLSATASSGLPVSFGAMGSCDISGSTVHLNGAGSCRITATQFGDSNYNGAAAVARDVNIAQASTSTNLSSSLNPSNVGQSVTFTATVTSPAGTPPGGILGSVIFSDGGVMLPNCAVPLNSGQASCTTNALSFGSHNITAEYSTTNPNFTGSTGTLQGGQTVNGGFRFSQAAYAINEGGGQVLVTVRRDGDTSHAASVDYATDDGSIPSVAVSCSAITGLALERCDYTRAAGTLSFAAGETQKTFPVLVSNDSYVEGIETASLRLSNPVGEVLSTQSTAILQIQENSSPTLTNPIDDSSFFVTQHYADFLNREPDLSGLQFWTNQMTGCGSPDTLVCRINVSAAFFQSIEFQQTGYLVERVYKTAYGDAAGTSTLGGAHQLSVPVVRLQEFLRDTQEIGSTPTQIIVGQGEWQRHLEANKQSFALEFVQRARFTAAYSSTLTAGEFVNRLDQNAGGVLSADEKTQLEGVFGGPSAISSDAARRAQVLRTVAEHPTLQQRESGRAFVLMQFYGYLRRDPDAAPDADYTGFDFWLTKLEQFNGNFIQAEMVKGFITSTEYRQRFGQ